MSDSDESDEESRNDAKRANQYVADHLDHVTFDSDEWNPEATLEDPDDASVPDLDYGPTFDESMETSTEDRDYHDDTAESNDPSGYIDVLDVIKEGYLSDDESNDATSQSSSTNSVVDALAMEGPSMMCLDEDSLQQLAKLGDETGRNLAELNKYLCKELEVEVLVGEMKSFSEEVVTNGIHNMQYISLPNVFSCLGIQAPKLKSAVSGDSSCSESFLSREDSSIKETVQSDPPKEESHPPSCSKDLSYDETSVEVETYKEPPVEVETYKEPQVETCEEPPIETREEPPVETYALGESTRQPSFSSFFVDFDGEEWSQPAAVNEMSRQPSFSSFFVDSTCEDSEQSAPPQEDSCLPAGSSCDDSVPSVTQKKQSCLPLCFGSIEDEEEGMEIPYASCIGTHDSDNTVSRSEGAPTTTARTRTAEMKERQSLLSKLLFGGNRKDAAKVAPAPAAAPVTVPVTARASVSRSRPEVLRVQLRDGSMASISRDTVSRLARCQWV
jgi:hypothetical protein